MLVWLCGEGVTGCCNCDEFAVLVPSLFCYTNQKLEGVAWRRQGDKIEKEWRENPHRFFVSRPYTVVSLFYPLIRNQLSYFLGIQC